MAAGGDEWTLSGEWIFPVDQPPMPRGTVTVDGQRIVAIAPAGQRTADIDLGPVAVLPGLVNAHTHLDLSGLDSAKIPHDNFPAWLQAVVAYRASVTYEEVAEHLRTGLAESLQTGTTLLGDISSLGLSWPILADASLRAVVYYEIIGLTSQRAERAWTQACSWLAEHTSTATCRAGLSPHAPYSVRASLFAATAELARQHPLPIAIHLAETLAERELLKRQLGPLVDFLRQRNVWDPTGLVSSWQEILDRFRDVKPVLFAHGNYLEAAADIGGSSMVFCPRTHAYFGHGRHPFRDWLQAGVNVALGTDSRASNPDLDMLAEMRFLHRQHPDVPGAVVLRMATLNGACALGWEEETGSLTPGKSADLVTIPLTGKETSDPHSLVFDSPHPVNRVLWKGQWRSA